MYVCVYSVICCGLISDFFVCFLTTIFSVICYCDLISDCFLFLYCVQHPHALCVQVCQLQAGIPGRAAEGHQDAEKTAQRRGSNSQCMSYTLQCFAFCMCQREAGDYYV